VGLPGEAELGSPGLAGFGQRAFSLGKLHVWELGKGASRGRDRASEVEVLSPVGGKKLGQILKPGNVYRS
jgi:hypothetical protein